MGRALLLILAASSPTAHPGPCLAILSVARRPLAHVTGHIQAWLAQGPQPLPTSFLGMLLFMDLPQLKLISLDWFIRVALQIRNEITCEGA